MNARGKVYGNDEFAAFGRRMLRAFTRRVSEGDVEGLAELAHLAELAELATGQAARALVADGYSWADVARVLGTSRQNAHKRYGKAPASEVAA